MDLKLSLPGVSRVPPRNRERPAVVCVDDDPARLEGLRTHLHDEPYELVLAPSLEEAGTRLGGRRVALLLLSPHWRGAAAREFRAALERRFPGTRTLLLDPEGRRLWGDALRIAIRKILLGRGPGRDVRGAPEAKGGVLTLPPIEAARLRAGIMARMGGFPPRLTPAFEDPGLLAGLWRWTVSSYLDNPLPALFKEKLFACLSRFSRGSYDVIAHASALHALGMKGPEILELLKEPPLSSASDLARPLRELEGLRAPLSTWPEPGSALDQALFQAALALFREGGDPAGCRVRLSQALGPALFARLAAFLAYVRASHAWAEMFPELSPDADPCVSGHWAALIAEEPRLEGFLAGHSARLRRERRRLEDRLVEVITALREREATLRTAQDELESKVQDRTRELSRLNAELAREVQERRAAEEALRERAIDLENALEGITRLDPRGRFVGSNRTFAELFGFESAELSGLRWIRTVEPRDRKAVLGAYVRMKREGRADVEVGALRKDGSRFDAHLLLLRASDKSGRFDGTHCYVKDITVRKQAQAERDRLQSQLFQGQKLTAIGQLSAGIAHEINNPVGYILSNLTTLGEYSHDLARLVRALRTRGGAPAASSPGGPVPPSPSEDLDFILEDLDQAIQESRQGAERIRDIVRGLKDFSHADEADLREADLNAILEDALRICWNEVKYKAEVKREYGTIPKILCCPMRLGQVFLNLMVNGAQAIEKHGTLTLGTRLDGGEVVAWVRDTGCGIPKENLGRLFEPFFTTKPVGKGTGLGLHVAYKIIQGHGGQIEVDSEPDRGTAFTVRLPVSGPRPGGGP